MPQESQRLGINLLPTQELEKKRVSPYVEWFEQSGFLVFAVCYLLMGVVLGYRWFLENQLTTLNSSINQKVAVVQSKQDFIDDFQSIQQRYLNIAQVLGEVAPKHALFSVIEETIPVPITLVSVSADPENMQIEGKTTDYLSINQWQYDLRQQEEVLDVTVSQVTRTPISNGLQEPEEQVTFILSIDLKK